jgi:hypothetical protein
LRVWRRDGTLERGLLEVVGDMISTATANCFDLVPPGAYVPRVTIDDLVVSIRYPAARAWAVSHGLLRHVFFRFTGEGKPIYADLTSLASIDLISRSLRRARRERGADATVTVVEMLPAPDQLWLTDAQGQRYTSELRLVAADQQAAVRQPTEVG